MPLYEYKCQSERCGATHTAFRSIPERARADACGVCGEPTQVQFTPPSVQNLSASRGSLRSWGRNLRLEGTMTMAEKIAKTDAARGDNRAATLGEAG